MLIYVPEDQGLLTVIVLKCPTGGKYRAKYRRFATGIVYQRFSFPARDLTLFELPTCR